MDSGKHTQYGWNGITDSSIDGGIGGRTVVLARCGRKHLRGFEGNHLGTKTPMRVARYDLHKFPHRTSFKEGKVGTFRSPQLQYPEDIAL
jgi:hypothetical protein